MKRLCNHSASSLAKWVNVCFGCSAETTWPNWKRNVMPGDRAE